MGANWPRNTLRIPQLLCISEGWLAIQRIYLATLVSGQFLVSAPLVTHSLQKISIIGTLGSGWTVTFTWAHKMAKITNFDRDTFLIHTLELKLRLLEC